MRITHATTLAVLAASVLLGGCATTHIPSHKPDPSMTALASSAKAIQKAMGQVATENQAHLGSPPAYRTPHKGPLAQKVTFNWAGPVVPAVRLLAKMAGYHFQTVGQAPAKPVTVSVRESEMPLFDALQDIGWEAGTHVGVVVDQTNKIVQLVYHGQGNS